MSKPLKNTPLGPAGSAAAILGGGGEMGALMRSVDWSRTAVGPVEEWPQSLRTALSILLETGFPMYIAWGPDFTQFYNDGYRPILGSTKHPAAMGISTRETFAEIWDIIGPMFHGVMEGTPTNVVDFMLPLDRHGFVEECYFIFSYSPIRQEDGSVGGVLVTVTETTQRVLGERRLQTSQALAARTKEAQRVEEACEIAAAALAENPLDLPFALVYLVDRDAREATLAGAAGLAAGSPPAPTSVDLHDGGTPWPIGEAVVSNRTIMVDAPPTATDPQPGGVAPSRALVLPILEQGTGEILGALVAAVSPRLLLDESYSAFLSLIASQIGTAITSTRAFEEAKARAEALMELDRAKTNFFSNVSHEFRTPLTLMLGPTEEALSAPERALAGQDLEAVYRNGLRLLKLVNSLLDFSRIEAGRMTASFQPTDLAAATTDLASSFRSAVERAGLSLDVRCDPLPEPVYVDRTWWEKIVLNLLSNAFKFTFEGGIEVTLGWRDSHVELSVRDSGTGIPADQLPHVFDRFHRVPNTRGRTHEGSGIGLSLVRELVAMHGGTISVSSRPGEGAEFVVRIPTGHGHLPADQIAAEPSRERESTAAAFVEEALRWNTASEPGQGASEKLRRDDDVRILVADDNADMRDYLVRLLGDRWNVDAVADGLAALEAAERSLPDVVVADVMMPGLDGFELLKGLRAGERTRAVPVIMLSARAGEESRVEGLAAGADDYLVKPFSARELIARVQTQIVRSKIRSVEEAHALRLTSILDQAPVAVAILEGPEHVFGLANTRYLELVGHRPMVGKPLRQALPEIEGQGFFELLDEVYASGRPHSGSGVRVLVEREGELVEGYYDYVYQPLFEDGVVVSGIAVVAFEVTELVRARQEAEAASRAKDEFVAILSHELRNPLAPITTALELLRLDEAVGSRSELDIIERQVRHLINLVEDLLDVSRIARGAVPLARESTDLADVVSRAIEMTAPALEARRHVLSVSVPSGLWVEGDARRLAQVVANLLTNAAKYTDPGGRITVRGHAEQDEVVVSVEDTGMGIAPEMLPHVFDLFMQERQAVDRAPGGLGLGLSIVRGLVTAHGGRVTARSEGKGHGAEFIVTLPRGSAPRPRDEGEVAGLERTSRDGMAVLVVDDNEEGARLLAKALRHLGHDTRVAYDGPQALEALRTFDADAALLDLGLPVMDGYELARRLCADERTAGLHLVAVTGYARPHDHERSREAGFDAHLVKPISVADADRVLRALRDEKAAR